MAGTRFTVDGFIPDPMPQGLVDKLPAIRAKIRELLTYCVLLNEGQLNEENTTKAVFHKCYHDETPTSPCEPEREI